MSDKRIEMALLTTNKRGNLSSIMMLGNKHGLMYQKHHLVKIDDTQSRMTITFEGSLNCSNDELIDAIITHENISSIENISIDNSANINTNTSLNSGSDYTILRAGYVITPEAIKIAENRLSESLGPAAPILVQSAVAKTKHIGDLYLLLSKELRGEARKKFLALVSDLPPE